MSEPCRPRRGEGYGACDDEVLGVSPSSGYELMHESGFPDFLRPERPTNPSSAYRRLKTLLSEAGLPDIRFHDLRHP